MRVPFGLERGQPVRALPVLSTARTSCTRSVSLILLLLLGCRTVPELSPVDLAERGWRVQQGQAVWKANKDAPGLSGEFVWAAHQDGRFLLQFLKTPITIVEARGSDEAWQIAFPTEGRSMAGRASRVPDRLGWLYLARALQGKDLGLDWAFFRRDERWTIGNARTGEMIEGYLRP